MAKRKPKPLVKFIGILVIFGALFLAWTQFKHLIAPEGRKVGSIIDDDARAAAESGTPLVDVCVVTWGGYAGGQYYNGGFDASRNSRFYTEKGILVQFHVMDQFIPSRNAFKNGDCDLLWVTVDAYTTETAGLREFQPVLLFQADWSRGGDVIVVIYTIQSVADLKGKRIAVAVGTPSQTMLLKTLQAGGLEYTDVEVVEVNDAIEAAKLFKNGQVDAAVVWSPDDDDCLESVAGSRRLTTTREAAYIIADGFFAKEAWLETNFDTAVKLYEGWMTGAAEINSDPRAKAEAAQILSVGLDVPLDFAENAVNNVRLTTHGDNLNFFGLNGGYTGVSGNDLYTQMVRLYSRLNLASNATPGWREVSTTRVVQAANLSPTGIHEAEGGMQFTRATRQEETAEAYASKALSVTFAIGSATLDQNGQTLIDVGFAETAQQFAASRIRVVGHTDNTGSRDVNVNLSRRRAQAVANYLISKYGFDPDRFIIVGRGPDEPVATNATEAGRAQNRRTEFQLLN